MKSSTDATDTPTHPLGPGPRTSERKSSGGRYGPLSPTRDLGRRQGPRLPESGETLLRTLSCTSQVSWTVRPLVATDTGRDVSQEYGSRPGRPELDRSGRSVPDPRSPSRTKDGPRRLYFVDEVQEGTVQTSRDLSGSPSIISTTEGVSFFFGLLPSTVKDSDPSPDDTLETGYSVAGRVDPSCSPALHRNPDNRPTPHRKDYRVRVERSCHTRDDWPRQRPRKRCERLIYVRPLTGPSPPTPAGRTRQKNWKVPPESGETLLSPGTGVLLYQSVCTEVRSLWEPWGHQDMGVGVERATESLDVGPSGFAWEPLKNLLLLPESRLCSRHPVSW